MKFLRAVRFILTAHYENRIDLDTMNDFLRANDIDMVPYLVQDIMFRLYDPDKILDGPSYDVDYCMGGIEFIIRDSNMGNSNEDVSIHLQGLGYYWTDEFVREIVLAAGCWDEFNPV